MEMSLSTHEQARLLQLLIERIDYDGRDGMISIWIGETHSSSARHSPGHKLDSIGSDERIVLATISQA